jgi:4-amino-4-deoxy-L-arabinose transferase-like glycosyltransferase
MPQPNAPVSRVSTGCATTAVWRSERVLTAILLVVCAVTFFFGLGGLPILDRDEGLHAVTSKEMVLTGDWVTTKFNGRNFYDKPVFFNWLVALSFKALGFTEFAARLPAALLGLGCVLITYFLGRKMYDPLAGFLGGMILATSPMMIALSRSVVHDISLLFFITLALFCFYCAYAGEQRTRSNALYVFYAALGCAALSKGPIGLILPGTIILLFLALTKKLSFIKDLRLPVGAVIVLAVAAPWYILISLRNSDYVDYFVRLNFSYFFSSRVLHARPFYYYVPILFGGFSPWSFFLPFAIVAALRRTEKKLDERALFLILWCAVIYLFFSFASSKLGTYILPLFPAAALLVGVLWRQLLIAPSASLRKGFFYSFVPLVAIFLLALGYLHVAPPTILVQRYGLDHDIIKGVLYLIVGILGIALVSFLGRYHRTFFLAHAAVVILTMIPLYQKILPSMVPLRSSKIIAQKADGMLAPGEPLIFFDERRDSALFYTNRKGLFLKNPADLVRLLKSSNDKVAIVDEKQLQRFPVINSAAKIIAREGDALLMTARTDSESPALSALPDSQPRPSEQENINLRPL